MLGHYLKLAFRNFQRHQNSFFINLIGLSTGLACALIIFLWVNDELKMDRFLENEAKLFRVMEHQQYAEEIMTTNSTPGPLADALPEEFPEIEYAATVLWENNFTLFVNDKGFKTSGRPVGADFLKIFKIPMIAGDGRVVLEELNSIVISESLAKKMFGSTTAAMGQTVNLNKESERMIGGIFADVPDNSTLKFDMLLPFDKFRQGKDWLYSWGNNGPSTYISLVERADYKKVSEKIKDFLKTKEEESNIKLFLKPFAESYLYGRYENGVQAGGRIEYVRLFSTIAIFILIIACINFMNLSTARASKRTKEVGVKKAIGVERSSLISQYLSESTLIALLSLVLAIIMVNLFLPQFNIITDKSIEFDWSPTTMSRFLGITLFTGLLAGCYPAFYLSSFQPVKVLKGTIKSSWGELWARRGLVVFQFTLSIILIVAVTVVYNQIQYVQTKNLGYKKDNLIRIPVEGQLYDNMKPFLTEAKKIPGIENIASMGHTMIGRNNNTSGLNWEEKDPNARILFENLGVNYDLLETIKVQLKEGRFFSRDFGADTSKIIFNEAAIKVMGLENPLGKTIRLWDQYDLEIIGVVEDFHFESLHEPVNPAFFRLSPNNAWMVMASLEQGKEKAALSSLNEVFDNFNSGFEFEYEFLDEEYARLYTSEQRVASLAGYFAGFAILISCLGLFGLAAFTADRKKKEDFTKLVLISIIIGLPIAWYVSSDWLTRFTYRIDLSIWFFAIAGILVLLISWLTVSSQAFTSAMLNPKDCLADE